MRNDDKNKSRPGYVKDLLEQAEADGTLSPASMQALDIPDIGAQIQAGLGIGVDDVASSEVVLVSMMPDDSGSIQYAGNADAVRLGHNQVLDALSASRQRDDILVHTRYLNGLVLYPYTPVPQAIRMDAHNYDPNLGTPLYDQTVVLLGTVLAKSQELAQNGVPVRTVTLIITDGADAGSTRAGASHVKSLVDDMLRAEGHIVAAMGIDDGTTSFRQVFRSMGIPDAWILTPRSTAGEVRKAFQVFSQSAVRASQSAHFSATALGGFAN
jgi:dihydroxyacetone kinase DhaKLM complex PTS-EIIA-like component DhaM